VIGLAAASILLKNCGLAPGRRTIVAGVGPLLPLVAYRILASGGKVAAIVDMNPLGAWFEDVTDLFSRPDQLARGAIWVAKLAAAGIGYYPRHAIVRVTGEEQVQAAVIAPVDQEGARVGAADSLSIPCDSICYGHGLVANLEAAKLLGAILQYDSTAGGWAIKIDQDQATSVNGLFACGDGAAIAGAAAAPYSGQIAALAVAASLGRLAKTEAERRIGRLRTKLRRAARFGQAMTRLCAPKSREAELISPSTVVCRCEAVTRATIDEAIAQGSTSLRAIKSTTRCGMGPCGGRYCSDATTGLLSAAIGAHRSAIAPAFTRPPLRPVSMEALIRDFRYESLSIPQTAPR
jgi:NAD(P)H-nitrite reductase large subunit